MFSLLVALTMYLTFSPARPAMTAQEFRPPAQGTLPLAATVERPPAAPVQKDADRLGVETASRAVMVADWKTGESLFEKNADAAQPIASISKLVTALTVLGTDPDWDAAVTILPSDIQPNSGGAYVFPSEQMTVRDLFNVSLVASSNEATVALARSTGLDADEFAAKMNETAVAIGMTGASFVEPTGLSSRNAATARDIAVLLRKALTNDAIAKTVAQKEYRFTLADGRNRAVRSTDELLGSFIDRDPYHFLGGKTGYIDEAGYCFGAAAENADGNGVIAVVLGAPSKDLRFKEVKSLMFWAFDAYEWPKPTVAANASATVSARAN